jgi:translation initiation factor IF-1
MAYSLTDSLKHNRFQIVSVDTAGRTVRLRGEAEVCTDVSCGDAVVLTDEGASRDLDRLNAGDIVTLEQKDGRAQQIRVVRRVWEEYSSPEW